eukprot:84714_1
MNTALIAGIGTILLFWWFYRRFQERSNKVIDHTTLPKHDVKIIVAGFPRSGTASLSRAFKILNYGTTSHLETSTFKQNRARLNWWVGKEQMYQNNESIDYEAFFDIHKVDIVMDVPLSLYWKQLLNAYPSAKVIVCTRDFDEWYKSIHYLVFGVLRGSWLYYATFIGPAFHELYYVWTDKFVNMFGGESVFKDKKALQNEYNEVLDDIRDTMKDKDKLNDLLIFNPIEEGWKPLCDFLDIKAIPNLPFPKSNTSQSLQRRVIDAIKQRVFTALGIQ